MKKLLLSGTAIVGLALAMGVSPAAANLDLNLGGKFSAYGVFASQDDGVGEAAANTRDFDMVRDTEIYFTGETTLDNGLTVGVEVQLEGGTEDTANDTVDEAYMYLAGDWGRVNVGSENGAAYLLQVGSPAVDSRFDGIEPNFRVYSTGNNSAATNDDYGMSIGGEGDRGDTEKLTYLSPVFAGVQVGVSYAAEACEDANGCTFPRGGLGLDNNAGQFEEELQIGARYAGEYEGVGVTLGAGYATAGLEANGVTTNDDRDIWNVGLNLTTAGFTLGGSYYEDNNGISTDGDTTTYTVGLTYETGAYTAGVSWLDSETEVGANAEDELTRILVGGSYAYGPGMTFNGAVHFIELEDDAGLAADENDATVFTLGTNISF